MTFEYGGRLTKFEERNIFRTAFHSGAPAGRQAEPHTHIGKKRKPMASGIARGQGIR